MYEIHVSNLYNQQIKRATSKTYTKQISRIRADTSHQVSALIVMFEIVVSDSYRAGE